MPVLTDEPVGTSAVWGTPVDFSTEPDEQGEPSTENDGGGDGEPSDSSSSTRESAPKIPAAERAAWDDELEKFVNGDTKSKLYPGFQRLVSKKDREIDGLTEALQTQGRQVTDLMSALEELGIGTNVLMKHLSGALPEEDVAKLRGDLLQAQNETLRKRGTKPAAPVAPVARQEPDRLPSSDDVMRMIEENDNKFVAGRQAAARKAGVDPADPALDYGSRDMVFADRLAVFEASLEKAGEAKLDADVRSVSQRKPVMSTSATSGGAPPRPRRDDGLTPLQRGARERVAELRKTGQLPSWAN